MKAIDLNKFFRENDCEYRWDGEDVILFVDLWCIKQFNSLLPSNFFDDEGVKCTMKKGYFAFSMEKFANYFDFELKDVFPR